MLHLRITRLFSITLGHNPAPVQQATKDWLCHSAGAMTKLGPRATKQSNAQTLAGKQCAVCVQLDPS